MPYPRNELHIAFYPTTLIAVALPGRFEPPSQYAASFLRRDTKAAKPELIRNQAAGTGTVESTVVSTGALNPQIEGAIRAYCRQVAIGTTACSNVSGSVHWRSLPQSTQVLKY